MSVRNRRVQVATVSQEGLSREKRDELIEQTLVRMDQAAACQPDILCLPEGFTACDEERVPERISSWAQEHRCWVICSIKVCLDGERRNSAVLVDREGIVRGRYDKIHPTEGEVASGIRPGPIDPPVFSTDFGSIGIQICFDVNFPESWTRLKQKGAEIVFFPAAFPAHRQLGTRAQTHEYYVVSSTRTRSSRIYDITGRVMAQSGYFAQWAVASLGLDKRLFEIDGHVGKVRQIEKKYGRRVEVAWYHDEDWFTLDSLDPELAVTDLIEEFELTPLSDYIRRSAAVQDKARG